jgi:GTPase KRas protein
MSEYRLGVVGGGGAVGKTALTVRLISTQFIGDFTPTEDDSYRKRVCIDQQVGLLDILDIYHTEAFLHEPPSFLAPSLLALFLLQVLR